MTVKEFLASVPESQKEIIDYLHKMILKEAPSLKPEILQTKTSPVLGYGMYHYKSKSGCEGEWFVLGLATRANYAAFYVCCVKDGKYITEVYDKEFSKFKTGKSCVQIKKKEDIDEKFFKKIIKEAVKLGPAF